MHAKTPPHPPISLSSYTKTQANQQQTPPSDSTPPLNTILRPHAHTGQLPYTQRHSRRTHTHHTSINFSSRPYPSLYYTNTLGQPNPPIQPSYSLPAYKLN
ncbi:unnamed protein product [Periconia digitata]|uniref:Uncharacterized protein n=1 Tax=Periconia digitata TaxID=1303443 RepID=A0A9W4XJ39_9PLEO|nr:unnamed protein product [Periconia digitata]